MKKLLLIPFLLAGCTTEAKEPSKITQMPQKTQECKVASTEREMTKVNGETLSRAKKDAVIICY